MGLDFGKFAVGYNLQLRFEKSEQKDLFLAETENKTK